MKSNVLHSPHLSELKKRRRRTILNKIILFFIGLLVIFFLLAYFSRLNSLNFNDIQIVGNKVIDTEIIRGVVEEQVAGNYLWIFPKTNILLYPKNYIKNELQDEFKRLKDINISIKDNKILEITVTERRALYIWCGIILPEINTKDTKCYFLDEDGYIFDEAPYFSDEVYFKFYGNILPPAKETENILGSYYFKQNFKQLISFKDVLTGIGLHPIAGYITSDGDVQIFLSGRASSLTGPKIIFKTNDDFQNVAENLQAALTTEPLQSEFKNKYGSLQYIDLRFGNKVYYKF